MVLRRPGIHMKKGINRQIMAHALQWNLFRLSAVQCFNILYLTLLASHNIISAMKDATFFTHPVADWQRRYEALRASFVERLPAAAIADRFGYRPGYVRLLRHLFRTGKVDIHEPPVEGKSARRRVSREVRDK